MEDAIVKFGFDCKVRKLSDKTVANYQKQLRYVQKYLKEEFQITEVEEIKSYHIKQFLAMMDDKHRKPRYINDLLKVVKTFLNYSSCSISWLFHSLMTLAKSLAMTLPIPRI